ncbi:TonB-dependent receptor [Achromobacter sp. GG226]|uniref:TonB-dependent receptor domain-containing protein n=1 Tax=Verticiella alkaliphila TaxID=2779529 RepID=UPI001C0BB853|nr:TonB-dependent receptor [Verticiella sp. GG226]MBU4609328.1 TonB-dependent receptor [Verticiella sp. GG226]
MRSSLLPRPDFALSRLTLSVLLALPVAAQAQTADNPVRLSDIVVTASGFEQEIAQAPASISVITREDLEAKPFRDLAEALKDVPGIDVQGGTGKTGGLDISIRGMPSDYTLILIDGRRQNVAGDITPNGFGAALTSFMPPVSAIERIEVIRGPMSTLYGSDAMGGVINIITRKVSPEWGGSASAQIGIPQHSAEGGQRRFNVYLDGPIVKDLLGIAIRGDVYRRSASDRIWSTGNARDPRPGESRQHTLGAKLSFTPNRNHDVWLDVEQGRTWYDNDDCRLGSVDYRNCATGVTAVAVNGYRDYLRFNRDQVAVGHSSRLGIGLLESSLTRSTTETLGRTIPSAARPARDPSIGTDRKLETTNTVFDTKLVTPLGESHILTTGAQWWDAKFTDGLLPENHKQTMWALFAEDEWRLTDSLTATLGGRYNHHDAFGGEFSPRGYLVWEATPNWTAKGGVSRGFRAPRLNQLIDGASGVSGQGSVISIGNPNLKPEISTSTEFGVLFDSLNGTTGSATLFHNRITNRITGGGDCTVNYISSCSANPQATYSINLDEGKTWGLELASRIALADRWSLNLNYTWTDSEAIENGVKNGKLSDTAKHIANAQLRWDATDRLNLWVTAEHRGKSRRFDGNPDNLTGNNRLEYNALGDLKAYTLLHLGGSYRVSRNVTLGANVYNVLDKNFDEYQAWTNQAGETVLGSRYFKTTSATKGTAPAGRAFWLTANVNF